MGDFGWSLFVALAFLVGYLFGRRNRPVVVHLPPQIQAHTLPVAQVETAGKKKPVPKDRAQWTQAPVVRSPPEPRVISVDFRGKNKKPKGPDGSGPKGAA